MASADGPSLAGPISDRVVKPEALRNGQYCVDDTALSPHPRPRPATYDAGAGIDKNANLFGLPDILTV